MFAFAQTLFFIITNPPQDTTYIFTELTLFCNRFEVTNVKTAGIITEYNPLHYGHLALIQAVRQQFGGDTAVICAMSGDFVQRGDFALVRRHARAEAAMQEIEDKTGLIRRFEQFRGHLDAIRSAAEDIRTLNYRQYEDSRLTELTDKITAEGSALKE